AFAKRPRRPCARARPLSCLLPLSLFPTPPPPSLELPLSEGPLERRAERRFSRMHVCGGQRRLSSGTVCSGVTNAPGRAVSSGTSLGSRPRPPGGRLHLGQTSTA